MRHPAAHLAAFALKKSARAPKKRGVIVTNRFGRHALELGRPEMILVPSAKRHCAQFEADTNVPIRRADPSLQQVATITKIRFTPYAGVENGACTTT